jgi:HEAT repeat protein
VISAVLRSAVDTSETVREAALSALDKIDPAWPENTEAQEALPDVVAALRSRSSGVSKAAFRLLWLIGLPAVPELAKVLSSEEDGIDKYETVRLLEHIGPDAACAVPGLTRALGSQHIQIRVAAAEALASIGPAAESAVPALMAGLADRYADGRQAMAACLAELGAAAEPAIPALMPLLADRWERVRDAAIAALEQIGPATVPALIEILEMRDVQRFEAWFESMMKLSHWFRRPDANTLLMDQRRALASLSWAAYHIREERASLEAAQVAAMSVLGKFGPAASAAVPTVARALTDPNPGVKLAAVETLGQIGPEARSVVPDLVGMLMHGSEPFQGAASKALGCIDRDWASNPCAAGVLRQLAEQLGKAEKLGESAVDTFIVIGTAGVPTLIDVLGSGNWVARANAASALGGIGAGAKAAVPALAGALEDKPSLGAA